MQIQTSEQYTELKAREARNRAFVDTKRGKNGWASYKPEEMPAGCEMTNEERSAIEVYEFERRTEAGPYFAYIGHSKGRESLGPATVSTFTGDKLADIIDTGKPYRCPAFGRSSTRQNFRARGIDGRIWSGTFYKSSGDYCRMRPVKG